MSRMPSQTNADIVQQQQCQAGSELSPSLLPPLPPPSRRSWSAGAHARRGSWSSPRGSYCLNRLPPSPLETAGPLDAAGNSEIYAEYARSAAGVVAAVANAGSSSPTCGSSTLIRRRGPLHGERAASCTGSDSSPPRPVFGDEAYARRSLEEMARSSREKRRRLEQRAEQERLRLQRQGGNHGDLPVVLPSVELRVIAPCCKDRQAALLALVLLAVSVLFLTALYHVVVSAPPGAPPPPPP